MIKTIRRARLVKMQYTFIIMYLILTLCDNIRARQKFPSFFPRDQLSYDDVANIDYSPDYVVSYERKPIRSSTGKLIQHVRPALQRYQLPQKRMEMPLQYPAIIEIFSNDEKRDPFINCNFKICATGAGGRIGRNAKY